MIFFQAFSPTYSLPTFSSCWVAEPGFFCCAILGWLLCIYDLSGPCILKPSSECFPAGYSFLLACYISFYFSRAKRFHHSDESFLFSALPDPDKCPRGITLASASRILIFAAFIGSGDYALSFLTTLPDASSTGNFPPPSLLLNNRKTGFHRKSTSGDGSKCVCV